MAPSNTNKINVKDRFTDGEVDLSMSDLIEVPVKDIALLKKVYVLDLSNNRIQSLTPSFPSLINISKLDLSKNELSELPENFGDLIKLKHLDLYQNQLQHLPLSFYKLKDLKWLDLKDNPLVPTVAKIAGPCLDNKQCQKCAKDVVNFFAKLQEQVKNELQERNRQRQKQLEFNQSKKQEEKKHKKKVKAKIKSDSKIEKISQNQTNVKKIQSLNSNYSKKYVKKSALVSFLLAFFISSTVLFILTSIKLKGTEQFEVIVHSVFNKVVVFLPSILQPFCSDLVNSIYILHQKTGNITLEIVNYIQNKDWTVLFNRGQQNTG